MKKDRRQTNETWEFTNPFGETFLFARSRSWFIDQPLDRDDSEDGRLAEELLEKLDEFLGERPKPEED